MSFFTVVDDEFFDGHFDDYEDDDYNYNDDNNDLDSLNVDKWSPTSSLPATPCDDGDVPNDLDNINEQLFLSPSSSSATKSKMENADERMQKCLYDIPHTITLKLIKSLDTDMGWEILAASTGFNFEEICELRQEERKINGSPTRSLLWKLGCQAYTLQMLHDKMKELNRIHDAEIIATYIMEGDRRRKPTPPLPMASPSKNSDYLQSYLSMMSISNGSSSPGHQPIIHGASNYYSPAGSEVNFNKQSMVDNTPMKVGVGSKMYEDKCIPGAKMVPQSPLDSSTHGNYGPAYITSQYSIPSSSCSDNNNKHQPSVGTDLPSFSTTIGGSCTDGPTRILREIGLNPILTQSSLLLSHQPEVAMSVKPAFEYQELVTATDKFSEKNILGEGGFGVVYYGHLRDLDCAVKRYIKPKSGEQSDSLDQINSELTALLRYQHENIVTLYGYALDGPHLCLVYQYLRNGSLEDRLKRKNDTPALSWERRLNILVGSCKAINFLHNLVSTPLIHGDIKSANILLDGHLEAKIADLGQSRYATGHSSNTGNHTHITLAQSTSRQYGSMAYQAPEIKSGCNISIKSDIYAMGVVILETCSGLVAYDYDRNENKYLADLYTYHFAKLGESVIIQEFQDKSPPDCINPPTFMSILKLASQCIKELKKSRPLSGKLMKSIQKIYDNQYQEQSFPKSLNSPTEDDGSGAITKSHYCSHLSEIVSTELNSSAPHPPPSPHQHQQEQMSSILQMQKEKYLSFQKQLPSQSFKLSGQRQQSHPPLNPTTLYSKMSVDASSTFNSSINNNPSIQPNPLATPPLTSPSTLSQRSKSYYHYQSSCPEQSASPSSQPSISYLHSFPPDKPLPEAYMLQKHYDDRLVSSDQLVSQTELSPSNANRSLSESQTEKSISTNSKNPVEQGVEQYHVSSSTTLASDPSKLAAMKMFDELGSCSINTRNEEGDETSVDISSSVSLKCDEKKMTYLKEFDDRVFQANKASSSNRNIVEDHSKENSIANGCSCNTSVKDCKTIQHNATEKYHGEEDNTLSSDQICFSSTTNPKELEAMHQTRHEYLSQSQCNSSSEVECFLPPSPSSQPQTIVDANFHRDSSSIKHDKMDSMQVKRVSNPKSVSGNETNSDQQRMTNRENLFLSYNAGLDDDEEGDEDDEDEDVLREEEYV